MSLKINDQLCQESFHYCFHIISFKHVTFQALLYPFLLPKHPLKIKDMGNANYGCKN
jgi:hypothetical protein